MKEHKYQFNYTYKLKFLRSLRKPAHQLFRPNAEWIREIFLVKDELKRSLWSTRFNKVLNKNLRTISG